MTARRKPYTSLGIKRVPCFRCGDPGAHQWQICADGNQYRAVCTPCDIALNETVLRFMGFRDADVLMAKYRVKIGETA